MKELQAPSKPLCSALERYDACFQHACLFKENHFRLLHKPLLFISGGKKPYYQQLYPEYSFYISRENKT